MTDKLLEIKDLSLDLMSTRGIVYAWTGCVWILLLARSTALWGRVAAEKV